jgi:hypothetical protein
LSSIISLRLHTQPGGFFVGFCRAQRMSAGEPLNGRDYQRTEPGSPSLLESSLKVKRHNAHGWGSRSGSPQQLQRVAMA